MKQRSVLKEPSAAYPWLLVLFYSLLGMTCPAAVTQYSMVANSIAGVFGGASRMVLLADSFRAVCLVIAMFISDILYRKIGLKKTIALGIFFQCSSQMLIPLAVSLHSVPLLFLFKGIQGCNAIAFPLYISAITMWVSDRYRGLCTAIFNGAFLAGGGVGSFITSRLAGSPLGWESSFFVLSILTMILAVPALLLTRDRTAELAAAAPVPAAEAAPVAKKGLLGGYAAILSNPLTWFLVVSLIANTWVSQAINVDMSVYVQDIGFDYTLTGNLMLIVSVITVVSSVMAGGVSDWIADRLKSPVKSRCIIMAAGYLLSTVASALINMGTDSFFVTALMASLMMFGVSWSMGVFYALPPVLYPPEENVSVVSFSSGASNIPNPIAPAVVGVLLGSAGSWAAGWMTCAVVSAISMAASLLILKPGKK